MENRFYLTSVGLDKEERKVGVVDRLDGSTEFYTISDLRNIVRSTGISVLGLNPDSKSIELFNDIIVRLVELDAGTPISLSITGDCGMKTVIYLGYNKASSRGIIFTFFDGAGVTGYFNLSSSFIYNNAHVKVDFDNCDPITVSNLVARLNEVGASCSL